MNPLRFLNYYFQFRGRKFADRAQLERWQENQVRQHLRWVAARSRWFGDLAKRIPIERWREWPASDKRTMVEHLPDWCTRPINEEETWALATEAMDTRRFQTRLKNGLTVGLSSGTSGTLGLFLVSDAEQTAWAAAMLARALPGSLFRREPWRLALFLRSNSNLYESTKSRRVRFEYFDLIRDWEEHWPRLEALAPHVIAAPPRVLTKLAAELREGRLRLRPQRIFSIAEVLEPGAQTDIEAAFQQPCHQIYQATEGFLGITCAHGTLHLNEDILVFEREPVPGLPECFRPVLTDFRRRTQPIIRYRLDDLLAPKETSCPCGSCFQALERVAGRSDETCLLLDLAGGLREMLPDFLRLAVARHAGAEFRIINHSPGEIIVELEDPGLTTQESAIRQEVNNACAMAGCRPACIRFARLPELSRLDKLQRVIRTNKESR